MQRQYTGTAGRIENSRVGVFRAYATSRGRALIDRRLYLPEHSWCQDTERRRTVGIPGDAQFATKPRLAGQMVAAALDAGGTASWVTGDEAYGQDPQLPATQELAFHLCWSPTPVVLSELVRVAGIRWCVEECVQAAKGQVGWTTTR